MPLHREFIENRADYSWINVSFPIYLGVSNSGYDVTSVSPEVAAGDEILSTLLLCTVTKTWNVGQNRLDISITASLTNTTGGNLTFNRVSFWRGGITKGNLGSAVYGTSSNKAITFPSSGVISGVTPGHRIAVKFGSTYQLGTVASVSGAVVTLVASLTAIPDGSTLSCSLMSGLFVGSTSTTLPAVVTNGQTTTLSIDGTSLTA